MKRIFKKDANRDFSTQRYLDTVDFSKFCYEPDDDHRVDYEINYTTLAPITINNFIGKEITKIIETCIGPSVLFYMKTGEVYIIHHVQEFYEIPSIQIYNDLNLILNKTITLADMYIYKQCPSAAFYRIGTENSYCVFDMWLGDRELKAGCECYEITPSKVKNILTIKMIKYCELE